MLARAMTNASNTDMTIRAFVRGSPIRIDLRLKNMVTKTAERFESV